MDGHRTIHWMTTMLERRTWPLVFVACGAYSALFSALSLWKYWNFGYNALDLGIFTQVAFNTAYGRFFEFTIHPHSYLGDHFEPLLLLFAGFMRLMPRPETLLVLQSMMIASGAIPLFLIARMMLTKRLALGSVLLYLSNPIVHSMNLFEFHLLPLALPAILLAALLYLQKRFVLFLIAMTFAILVREDVALVTALFSILAFLHRRAWKWKIVPLALSGAWFVTALSLIRTFNQYGSYKFAYYYSWLGDSAPEMLRTVFADPLRVLGHLATLDHLAFVAGLLLPLALLPLLAPRFLLLSVLPWLQIAISSFGATVLSLETHYPTLLLPGMFIAVVEGFDFLQTAPRGTRFQRWIHARLASERPLLFAIVLATTLYSALTLGPLGAFIRHATAGGYDDSASQQKRLMLERIPADASVAASYDLLAPLATRPKLYSMHYAFIGQKQYSREPYALPSDVDSLVIDGRDLLTYQFQFAASRIQKENLPTGDDRLRNLVNAGPYALTAVAGERSLWEKSSEVSLPVFSRSSLLPARDLPFEYTEGAYTLHGLSVVHDTIAHPYDARASTLLPLRFVWSKQTASDDMHVLQVSLQKNGKKTWSTLSSLPFGFLPTNEWQPGEYIETLHWILVPRNELARADSIAFELVDYTATLGLNALRSADHLFPKVTPLASTPMLTLPLDSPVFRDLFGSKE